MSNGEKWTQKLTEKRWTDWDWGLREKKDQADDNSKQTNKKSLTIVEMDEHRTHWKKNLQRIKKHILKWNILSEREKDTHTKKS